MIKKAFLILLVGLLVVFTGCKRRTVEIDLLATSDLHGRLLSTDMLTGEAATYSLASCATIINTIRFHNPNGLVLMDVGDCLQGDPSVYYFNNIAVSDPHIVSSAYNYLEYDAVVVGNHDVEAGTRVFDHVNDNSNFPWLAANIIRESTGKPYYQPYTIVERMGVKIAILGLSTPATPNWVPRELRPDMRFNDILTSAQEWVSYIRKNEKPDLIVALIHSGYDSSNGNLLKPDLENASLSVARLVPDVDVIFFGHDHTPRMEWVRNVVGDSVLMLNPGERAEKLARAKFTFDLRTHSVTMSKGELLDGAVRPDLLFNEEFAEITKQLDWYSSSVIGYVATPLNPKDGLFGPSLLMDYIHMIQKEITGAPISFCSLLSNDQSIPAGPITIRTLFSLYKYDNRIVTILLTGKEIDLYLEHAAALQFNQMKSKEDHLLRIVNDKDGHEHFDGFTFNISCASGIRYEVDVRRPAGDRVTILSMTDGTPFSEEGIYSVAMNSYQAQGGGGFLTKGVGLTSDEIRSRVQNISNHDFRYYTEFYLHDNPDISIVPLNEWKVIPESWWQAGRKRDWNLVLSD